LHSLDNSAENNIFIIEESQGGTHRDVKLTVVCMFCSVVLAHAQKADLRVLDLERLVGERTIALSIIETSSLKVQTWHDSVKNSVFIKAFSPVLARAQIHKILASFRCDVLEKFKHH